MIDRVVRRSEDGNGQQSMIRAAINEVDGENRSMYVPGQQFVNPLWL